MKSFALYSRRHFTVIVAASKLLYVNECEVGDNVQYFMKNHKLCSRVMFFLSGMLADGWLVTNGAQRGAATTPAIVTYCRLTMLSGFQCQLAN